MNDVCEVIRDLMPLYLDGVASAGSRRLVEDHLSACEACRTLLSRMKSEEVEAVVKAEADDVLAGQRKCFRRRSALIGGVLAGLFMIPTLVCLLVNLAAGEGLTWFFLVLASLMVAASLSVVPLLAPRNKGLWTLGAFTLSLLGLLGVSCLIAGGRWFFMVSAAVLFGLGVVFLPAVARSAPLSAVLKQQKALAVLTADTLLYGLMMLSIGLFVGSPWFARLAAAISLPVLVLVWAIFAVIRYVGKNGWVKAGLCVALCGAAACFADLIIGQLIGSPMPLPAFSPFVWNAATLDGNLRWLSLIVGALSGVGLILIGLCRGRKKK